MPTLKERLENNIVIVVAGVAVTAFAAGFGAHAAIAPPSNPGGQPIDWHEAAKSNGWIDKSECQALLVTLRMLSPGNESSVPYEPIFRNMSFDLVISASQSLPPTASVGYIANIDGDKNFYVVFPIFPDNSDRTLFRHDETFKLPKAVCRPLLHRRLLRAARGQVRSC
jgi:hypothetical protein